MYRFYRVSHAIFVKNEMKRNLLEDGWTTRCSKKGNNTLFLLFSRTTTCEYP